MQRKSTVIFDLDNTLWDWVLVWHESFSAMLDRIASDSRIPRDRLISEFQEIHRRHGTAEYAFSIEELPSLRSLHPDEDLRKRYDSAVQAYRAARDKYLALYPGVLETLEKLKDRGCLLVGYTESLAYYTSYRLRQTGLDRVLDILYSPADHDLPTNMTAEQLARHRATNGLRRTLHRHTPKGELKPNPKILLDIIREVGSSPELTVYIGDSELKDVAMAQDAGVTDVWAKYGIAQHRPEYELLRRVSHWSDADIERERAIGERFRRGGPQPSKVLDTGLEQLMGMFEFVPFVKDDSTQADRVARIFEAWQKTVDVQQHFNDIEMRIRNFAITIFAAVVSGVVLSAKEGMRMHVAGVDLPAASCLAIAGLAPWSMFYFMDHHWYHVFLKAAGKHAGFIEQRWADLYPEMGLSTRISRASTYKFPFRWFGKETSSTHRLRLFYAVGGCALLMMAVLGYLLEVPKQVPSPAVIIQTSAPSTGIPAAPVPSPGTAKSP